MADINATLDLDARAAFAQVDAIERRIAGATGRISLDLDTGTAVRDLDRVADEADEVEDALGRAEGRADRFGTAIKGAVAAIGAREALQGIVKLVDAASDLDESTSKASVVFEDNFGQIAEFAEGAATAVGLTEAAALEATGTFGNLFRAQGLGIDTTAELSTGIVQLAADLASFNNIEVAEAVEKLRAGLIGEVEPVRTLGINFDAASVEAKAFELGLAGANGEVDNAAKLQARYAIFLEQTTTAQGDFARTSDGMANASRIAQAELGNLAAELGRELLPVALEIVSTAREELIPAIRDVGPALASIVSSGGTAVLDLFLALLPVVESLAPVLETFADAIALVPGPVLALAGAGIGASRGLRALSDASELAEGATGKLRGKLIGGASLAAALLVVSDVAQQAGDALGDALGTTLDDVDVEGLKNDLIALRDGLDDVANLDSLGEAFGQGGIDSLGEAIDRITDPTPWDRLRDATESALGPLGTGAPKDLRAAREAVEGLDEALVAIAREDGVEQASQALTAFADSQGLSSDELERLLPLLDDFQNEVDAYGNEVARAAREQDDASRSTSRWRREADDAARDVGRMGEATETSAEQLGLLDRIAQQAEGDLGRLDRVSREAGAGLSEAGDGLGMLDRIAAEGSGLSRANEQIGLLDRIAREADGPLGNTADGIGDLGDEAGTAAALVADLSGALDYLIGLTLDVDDATAAFQDSLDALVDVVVEAREDGFGPLTDVLDETDPAARKVAGAFRDATGDLLAQVAAADEAGTANYELARIIREGIDDLIEQGREAGLTAEQIQTLVNRYGLIPEEIITSLGIEGVDAVIEDIERILGYQARLDRNLGIVVSPGGSTGPGGIPENAAEGRIYTARPGGRLIRVAEGGADEVVVPTNQPLRAAALLEQAGIVEPVPVAAGAPAGAERGPAIGSLTLVGYDDPDRAMRTVYRRVNDAEFLAGGF